VLRHLPQFNSLLGILVAVNNFDIRHTTMYVSKRLAHLTAALVFAVCVSIIHHYHYFGFLRYDARAGGPDEQISQHPIVPFPHGGPKEGPVRSESLAALKNSTQFLFGKLKSIKSTFSRAVVISCLSERETEWVKNELSDIWLTAYVANDTAATLHPPRNKGHEVMIYLSYIIDHYADLPDIAVFMHAHRWARHNNELLDHDAVRMIQRLSSEHVVRQGYVNMRCKWEPGCPEWLHPTNKQESLTRQEEMMLSKSWAELFPFEALPPFLAQACCAQFALSKERILSIPLSQFIYYRDWVLTTPLSDYVSGRIWEYSWHFLFTGYTSYCPMEHDCYCETYGICFDGQGSYEDFQKLRRQKEGLESELEVSKSTRGTKKEPSLAANSSSTLTDQIQLLETKLAEWKASALKRGDNRRQRAEGSS
jgi:hypothetical protein